MFSRDVVGPSERALTQDGRRVVVKNVSVATGQDQIVLLDLKLFLP
jgi:hypothetical protein